MKMKTLEFLRNFQHKLSRSRRWLFVSSGHPVSASLDHASSRNRQTFCCCFIPSQAPSRARLVSV